MTPPTILLIDDRERVFERISAALSRSDSGAFGIMWAHDLYDALERIGRDTGNIAAILLTLCLPDYKGLESFDKVFRVAPDIPLLILSEDADESLAREAVQRGAQDYLLPRHLDGYSLSRALRNAIDRKAAEDALYVEKDRGMVTLNSIGDAVLCTDISGNISYLNLVAETLTGWPHKEAIGLPLNKVFRIIDGATRRTAQDPLEMAVEQNRTVGLTLNCVLIRRDGVEFAIEDSAAPIHDRSGRIIGAVIVFHDVSAARAMALQMTHAAHHDLVTGLPNRLLLSDRISQAIALAHRHKGHLAVMFVDLDHFKYINDSLGHAVGDKLLQSISTRLTTTLRHSDTVSRQGGDEFVILLTEIANPEDAARSAEKILVSLGRPHTIDGRMLHVNSSVGISIYPENGADAEALIHNADMAMYHAKDMGRNGFYFFAAEMNRKAVDRQALESDLHRALTEDEFVLHYQPKINLNTGAITGCEALIRWKRSGVGLVYPAQFISVAEECGLIVQIGRWVLREACRQVRAWQDAGFAPVPVAVNVSAVEFRDKEFIEEVRAVLASTGLQARYLELELTESVLMKDAESTISVLTELKRMGIHLAVDDFGTGYSSLSYLTQFPINILKVDRSFVNQIIAPPSGSILVSAIIQMGRSLRHTVVAEGIETEQQREFLIAHHCAEGQGYLFSPPLPDVQFSSLLKTRIRGVSSGTASAP